jgi:hypothetical protein
MEEKILKEVPKSMEIVKPAEGQFSPDLLKKWAKNVFLFSALPFAFFILAVADGKSVAEAFRFSLLPALGNAILDLYNKYKSDTPYLRTK